MPRGKIVKDNVVTQQNESAEAASDVNDSKSASKFTIVEPEVTSADVHEDAEASPIDLLDRGNSNTLNFKFTLLLVALFVAVNIGLVALLDENKSTPSTAPAQKNESASTQSPETPAATEAQDKTPPQNNTADENSAPDKPVLGNTTADTNVSKPQSNPSVDDHPAAASADVQPATVPATEQTAQPSTAPAAESSAKQEEKQQPSAQAAPAATEQQDLLSIISRD